MVEHYSCPESSSLLWGAECVCGLNISCDRGGWAIVYCWRSLPSRLFCAKWQWTHISRRTTETWPHARYNPLTYCMSLLITLRLNPSIPVCYMHRDAHVNALNAVCHNNLSNNGLKLNIITNILKLWKWYTDKTTKITLTYNNLSCRY